MDVIEQHFQQWDSLIERISTAYDLTYMDALTKSMELLLAIVDENDPETTNELKKLAKAISIDELDREQIRKLIQLLLLKSMKGAVQHQHVMTPDTVALYVSYLVEKLLGKQKNLTLFDPVSGTANLLTAVMNHLNMPIKAYGSEIDPTYIQLAALNASMQEHEIEFFHQDSLKPLLLDPVDLVIADLPVGYYPDDQLAKQYQVSVTDDHTYAHHLLIEQSLNYTKPAGYLIFVIPNHLFNSAQAKQIHTLIQQEAYVIGLLQLPATVFKSERQAKSLFILQKKADGVKAPKQALMAQLPSFKDSQATERMVMKMNQWFEEEGY